MSVDVRRPVVNAWVPVAPILWPRELRCLQMALTREERDILLRQVNPSRERARHVAQCLQEVALANCAAGESSHLADVMQMLAPKRTLTSRSVALPIAG